MNMGVRFGDLGAFFYLYRKSFKNRVKKALHKPVTYLYLVLAILYFAMIFGSFQVTFDQLCKGTGIERASVLTVILTVLALFLIPANLISYSKRKGLIFRPSDIHFLFPAPVSPKGVLLYAHVRTVFMELVLNVTLTIGGVLWFHMPVWKMLLFLLFSCIVENILEASLMVVCYGNERLSRRQMFVFQLLMYALMGSFVLIGIAVYMKEGTGFGAVAEYLHGPAIQMTPVVGWYIALLHLFFLGPTTVNVVCSILYFLAVFLLFVLAVRMKCTGAYYEDAIKFAEDYEEARQKNRKGEMAITGWKQKYGRATVAYKGSYAKALFYRQLLEYKKSRFFIFGFYTLLCFGIGITLAILGSKEDWGDMAPFVILGVMAYLTFIYAAYTGKWGKELTKPYTYLIPDSAFRKLWYATLMEHVRSLVDGCLLTLPPSLALGLPVFQIALILVVYVCLQACKLYAEVMVEAFLGNILGSVGKQFARLFFEGLVIGLGIMGAALGTILVSLEVGMVVLIVVAASLTAVMMIIASINFERMESVGG